tara:strand:- start:1461 stop:2249 length:789 start_codon:yes stop_codon:yes gene_type:complete
MITVEEFQNKAFSDQGELFKALRENKASLIAQKKMATKFADPIFFSPFVMEGEKMKAFKADTVDVGNIKTLSMDLAINTTNLMDSHSDVHIPGLWTKSLKEKKDYYLIQEHAMKFDSIITDEVVASAVMMNWKDLGANYPGQTQVLLFKVNVGNERNPFMFGQYAKGYVKNHSVGMRYMKLDLGINSESKWDAEEKEIWDKYIDQVANREQAEDKGYFWAVTEAKVVEGSAVPMGSNWVTPTISIEGKTQQNKANEFLTGLF